MTELWRLEVEKRVDSIKVEVSRLNKFMERENLEKTGSKPGIFSGSVSACPPVGYKIDRSIGHLEEKFFEDNEHAHVLDNGMFKPILNRSASFPHELSHAPNDGDSSCFSHGRLPKMNFPVFDGENPMLRRSRCERYFEMYGMKRSMWIKVASMHLEGLATRWLQSAERRLKDVHWEEFCQWIRERFGKEEHESLIRQLFHIKKTNSISEYVDKFAALVDPLDAYLANADSLYYTLRFIDGIKSEIQNVVMVQRPSTQDSACSLALVQEVGMESNKRKSC